MRERDDVFRADPRALRHIEAERHGSRHGRVDGDGLRPGAERDLGGLRVAVEVPFRRRRRVSRRPEGAAHQDMTA